MLNYFSHFIKYVGKYKIKVGMLHYRMLMNFPLCSLVLMPAEHSVTRLQYSSISHVPEEVCSTCLFRRLSIEPAFCKLPRAHVSL